MPATTTIEVSVRALQALRQLAEWEGLTLDAQLERMIMRERRRLIGAHLSRATLDGGDAAFLNASVGDVADLLGH